MDKENVVYTHNGIYSATKKKEILPFAMTWIKLEGIMLSEISQTEKDKYCNRVDWRLSGAGGGGRMGRDCSKA